MNRRGFLKSMLATAMLATAAATRLARTSTVFNPKFVPANFEAIEVLVQVRLEAAAKEISDIFARRYFSQSSEELIAEELLLDDGPRLFDIAHQTISVG